MNIDVDRLSEPTRELKCIIKEEVDINPRVFV